MDTQEFFELDFMAGLFPLKTNMIMMANAGTELAEYLERILSDEAADASYNFLGQERANAAKPNSHVRRRCMARIMSGFSESSSRSRSR